MPRILLLLASVVLFTGCPGERAGDEAGADAQAVPADSITQRQRDSVIGESGLPGARGVRGALDASDAAAARAAAVDSLSGGR